MSAFGCGIDGAVVTMHCAAADMTLPQFGISIAFYRHGLQCHMRAILRTLPGEHLWPWRWDCWLASIFTGNLTVSEATTCNSRPKVSYYIFDARASC